MNHAIPQQYTEVLAACQDRAPSVGFDEVRTMVESELGDGRRLEDAFSSFERHPVAAASLAQVHRAITAEGDVVAVKVQYPRLARQVAADLRTMRVLAFLAERVFTGHSYSWLLPEFEGSMSAELDFRREAANAEQTAANFATNRRVHVPTVVHALSSARMLTMEFVDGVKVDDLDGLSASGVRPSELAPLLSDVFSAMIFEHGHVHCDPHPGNLLARRDADGQTQLVLLDHGMYRNLQTGFRTSYAALWAALLTRDHTSGRRAAAQLGVPLEDYDALSLLLTFRSSAASAGALGAPISSEERARLRQRYGKLGAADVNAFLERLPRDMLFVMRTWALVRSLNRNLGGTSAQRFHIIAEHAAAALVEVDDTRRKASSRSELTWRGRAAAQLRGHWARLRMRLVVRAIDYVGRLSLRLMQLHQMASAALPLSWQARRVTTTSGAAHVEGAQANKLPKELG